MIPGSDPTQCRCDLSDNAPRNRFASINSSNCSFYLGYCYFREHRHWVNSAQAAGYRVLDPWGSGEQNRHSPPKNLRPLSSIFQQEYLSRCIHPLLGLEPLSIAYSLPYALLIWGWVTIFNGIDDLTILMMPQQISRSQDDFVSSIHSNFMFRTIQHFNEVPRRFFRHFPCLDRCVGRVDELECFSFIKAYV